jgi:non-homologous end joining protein Ku
MDGQGEELALMTKIVAKMAKDLDLIAYHDGYKEG